MITWLPYWVSTVLAYLGLVTAAVLVIEVVVGLWLIRDDHHDLDWTEDDIS